MTTNILTQARLKELLKYDPKTGLFTWLVYRGGPAIKGATAGCLDSNGYIKITVDYHVYKAHRLAFLYMTGSMPVEVDHENHIKNDNKWGNLLQSSRAENARNQSMHSTNTSGVMGVCWCKIYKKWRARIHVKGRNKFLGYFDTFDDASEARKTANVKYGFHDNHGLKS